MPIESLKELEKKTSLRILCLKERDQLFGTKRRQKEVQNFYCLESIETLDLSFTFISHLADLSDFSFVNNGSLKHLNLEGNNTITDFDKTPSSLYTINLASTNVTEYHLQILPCSLQLKSL